MYSTKNWLQSKFAVWKIITIIWKNTLTPSVIDIKLFMICVLRQIHSNLIPGHIHMPLRFGTTYLRNLSTAGLCLPLSRLFIPILCNICSLHLVLFGPVWFLMFPVTFNFYFCLSPFCILFSVLGNPLIHCSSILDFAWPASSRMLLINK